MSNIIFLKNCPDYDENLIMNSLPNEFFNIIKPTDRVVLKPNWVKESHLRKKKKWEYVITHPVVLTAVIKKVLQFLQEGGGISIIDGPQTDSSFKKIIKRYPVNNWKEIANKQGVNLEIIDLREDEWIQKSDITISRKKLPGDPRGKVEINLFKEMSEFWGHVKSKRGYYGADYNLSETNRAHDGKNNIYRVSRTAIDADVFINLPKLKTHKKAGITCCLKNLVGINTYKNFLPHHSEGSPTEGGDQYPRTNLRTKIEGPLLAFLKQNVIHNTAFAKILQPFRKIGELVFGKTNKTLRSGNWYGNDTLWRTVLDLNKILFYANTNGTMRDDSFINAKKYIGIVDGILAGDGNGPLEPDPVEMGYILVGNNPVAIDCVCARLMGFDPMKIPSIKNAFSIQHYKIVGFSLNDIYLDFDSIKFNINSIPFEMVVRFEPYFGWKKHIEYQNNEL